ncbi:chalcone isomerase family protein [Massilia sp. TSP1-1-2]|uniref:chalcone isomerase family protein n=1 Tax=unclassified Massilia TaxID=2609279 RepID=UPI003CEFD07B
MIKNIVVKTLVSGALLAGAFGQSAIAAEVAGIKFADTAKVGGKELQLNGLGVRTKFIVKVYAAGLYLQDKKSTAEEVFAAEGPRRMQLVIMRDISSEDFGNAFMSGINNNLDGKDKTKIVTQISKFGEIFAAVDGLKKGDVLDTDYIPGQGTICILNGKRLGEVTPEVNFNNAVLKIWLGNKPADNALKLKLLAPAAASAKK